MKIAIGMITVVLFVSSCGLFKRTTKTNQSETTEETSLMTLDSIKEKEMEVKTETDLQSFVWLDGETMTQLEGEDIRIHKDGTILMGRGKVNQKSREKSNTVQLVSETTAVKQLEKQQTALETKQKNASEKKASNHVSKPESSMFFWICIGVITLILLCFWWIRKKVR